MPRAKKYVTKLQPLTGDDLEEQLSRTIIVHPGSRSIQMMRPLDREAVIHVHCIARRQHNFVSDGHESSPKKQKSNPGDAEHESFRNMEAYGATKEFKQSLTKAETWLKENSNEEKAGGRLYCSFDEKDSEEVIPYTKEYAVGNSALDVAALNNNYLLSWPLHYGRFNLHDGPGGSRSAVTADLEQIWDWILLEELEVPRARREEYRVLLIIPDIYDRDDVRCMVEILLVNLGFFAVFIVLENVASMYGAAVPSALVVDVGAEKTVISCVDEGISLPDTRILLHYGGDDITRFANLFLHQKLRSFTLKLNHQTEWFKMDAIKKALCHYDYSLSGSSEITVNLPSPDREESVQLKVPQDMCRLPGIVLFVDSLVCPASCEKVLDLFTMYEGCGEDFHGAGARNLNRKLPSGKKAETKERPEFSSGFNADSQENSLIDPPITDKHDISETLDESKFLELHRAVFWSVSRCATEEQRQRMLKNILLVGGGYALFPGAQEFFRKKLEEVFPPGSFELEFVANTREVPVDVHAFKGASVMAALETVQCLWITKEEWMRNGVKVLREKSSFGW